jgi:hypothetical protein
VLGAGRHAEAQRRHTRRWRPSGRCHVIICHRHVHVLILAGCAVVTVIFWGATVISCVVARFTATLRSWGICTIDTTSFDAVTIGIDPVIVDIAIATAKTAVLVRLGASPSELGKDRGNTGRKVALRSPWTSTQGC